MFAILGSGFGIYGYLPTLVDRCSQRIVLPERYRVRFNERHELAFFSSYVQWEVDENAALNCAEGVVLALRPINQCEWVRRCVAHSKIDFMLLEKPLAHTPEIAAEIFDCLINSQKTFRIGYTFRYTDWGQWILNSFKKAGCPPLSIHWSFFAHHFRHDLLNWKRFNSMGGGAIRFYGIHIIALLAEAGYHNVTLSRAFGSSLDEAEKWIAIFVGPGLPECEVVVDTRSTFDEFSVEYTSNPCGGLTTAFSNLKDPFDSENEVCQPDGIDPRVSVLAPLCRSLWEGVTSEYDWYDATITLWHNIEKKTRFEICN